MAERQKPRSDERTMFIGVAWPYVNGELHVGHLGGYLLPADIFARYLRSTGNNVLMVSGSDCFGTPITVEADKRRVSPADIVGEYHEKDVHLFKDVLGLTYDIYTRTDEEHHIGVVQDFFVTLLDNGYIFVDSSQQYFSPEDKRFLPDRYVEGTCKNCGFVGARSDQCDNCGKVLEQGDLDSPRSKLSGTEVELRETEHYFLNWPKLQPLIEGYVKQASPEWKHWVRQETLGWLKKGLKPRAISRDIDWGVPLPLDRIPQDMIIDGAEHKRLYVWFDAVIGYLSASQLWAQQSGGNWEDYWKNKDARHYYFMGKDNLIFHTIFWPGQLMGYDQDLHLPDVPSINMFLNYEGRQFSKSRGVTVPIQDIVEKYGNDPVRFYLTYIMPETRDTSFAWLDFEEKHNEVLVGNFGNFVNRVLSMAHGVDIQEVMRHPLSVETAAQIEESFSGARAALEECKFKSYLDSVLSLSSYGNKYIDYEKVWVLKKNDPDKFKEVLRQLYALILGLGYLSSPVMPGTSEKIFALLGINAPKYWPETGEESGVIDMVSRNIDSSVKPSHLFKKIELNSESATE